MALSSSAVERFHRARVDLAQSDVERERLWSSTALSYSREDAGDTEQFFTVTQPLDISGRRALRRRAAERRVEAAEQEVLLQRLDLEMDVRRQFVTALHQQELVRSLEEWTKRIAAAAETVRRLQTGGEVSGYDWRRVERERISAVARLQVERGVLAAARKRLAGLIGTASLDEVVLAVGPFPRVSDDLMARLTRRPDLAALQMRMEAATLDVAAEKRWRIPSFDLTAGAKVTALESGLILGAVASLPLFNRNQAALLRANAELAVASAEHAIRLTRARGEAEGLAVQAAELRRAATTYRLEASPVSARLVATAETAYRAGEVGILELLDAYRGAIDAEVQANELERRARETEIELARVIGGGER